MKIGVIGCGAYSLAISLMLNKNNHKVTIWSESQEKIDIINDEGMLNDCLPGIRLPEKLSFTTSLQDTCSNKDIIFLIVAAQYVENIVLELNKYINNEITICIATKGIEQNSCKFIHELVLDNIKTKNLVVLSGPGFAIDVAQNEPVGLTIASKSPKALEDIKTVLSSDTIKLRMTKDVIGTEICGSIKNVIAIAAGIIDGLGYKESTQAFLITESIHDIKALIKALDGDGKTVLSFAGIGDLLLTCTSTKSRNFSFGKLLGTKPTQNIINNYLLENTVEGYYTLKSINKLSRKHHIDIELFNLLYDIVFNNEDPRSLMNFLISKE